MKLENEITVKVNCDYTTLDKDLKSKNFKIVDDFQLNDIYMIPNGIKTEKLNELEVLSHCVLVRDIVGIRKELVYKYKKYNSNGDIIVQSKTRCKVYNIEDAINFLEAIGYREIIKIYDRNIIYTNGIIEIAVQLVNDKYIFIEMEDENKYISGGFSSIDEMKKVLDKYNIDYDKSNYFVKKAVIILNEIYKKNETI